MSAVNTLPRVLMNPKLHRRPGVETLSRSNPNDEGKRHKCPPIEPGKDKLVFNLDQAGSHIVDAVRSFIDHQQVKDCTEPVTSPLSPADGLSPASTAMANACSHDHDYLSTNYVNGRDDSKPLSDTHVNFDKNGEVLRPWPENKIIVRIPIPPKPPSQSSPRDVTRDFGSWSCRRVIKPSADQHLEVIEGLSKTRQKASPNEDTCIFKSTCKTAQPLRKSRPRRKAKLVQDENALVEKKEEFHLSSSSRNASTNKDHTPKLLSDDSTLSDQLNDFDIATDKLTLEWQSLVKSYQSQFGDDVTDASDADFGHPIGQSTPSRTETENDFPLPHPSVTPSPPSLSRSEKFSEEESSIGFQKEDSAYFSLNSSSSSSVQPNTSTGTPIFRSTTSSGYRSRPSTGHESVSSVRPPSSGKRVASESLSSTSSGGSSDDDSVCSSISSLKPEDHQVSSSGDKCCPRDTRTSSDDSLNSIANKTRQDHKVVKLRKGKKFVRQIDDVKAKKAVEKPHIQPLPPRKPKKDPLPMHHRALPVSFFQEPNKVNLTSYQTLPPLQPLFRQPIDDDIADLRPITPPDQQRHHDDRPCDKEKEEERVVIRRGDTDLLNRLFDAIDPQHQSGRRVKRGRPKRPPRILPSPKLTLDDNPYIMKSITENLFPNLSLEKRHHKHRGVKGHSSTLLLGNDKVSLNSSSSHCEAENPDKDFSQFGFLSFNSSNYNTDEVGFDSQVEMSSPTNQRQEFLALPHLPYSQDYSQMLSDVAAVL